MKRVVDFDADYYKQKDWEREMADADRAAAEDAVCPYCEHRGMIYGVDSLNQPWFKCPKCGLKDYI